ncbi:cyclopropane-fatty-acyl-phospholipid synthase [Mycobacterium sp. 852002-51163_SCH5372311]|uniref:SAM-dependent methyltransferase n=1 Tax=Mycobacterium sp. 852002-51163_SCH5372311 TaxID=1834097 RepID=UPI0007FC5010|nr:cyclopropane-fatty-acyl-phospholipid synthase family protein [Mycobacterium sp. 852002-51163_SCH5372311]OBF81538.1 cyclopropane-fatty-acyl-phospholipid synthase [Mycobacterium sp. 852002-51163_SCH5372311]
MLLFDRAFRKLIKQGELIVSDADGKVYRYGVPYPGRDPVAVRFTTKSTSRKIVMAPSLGTGEAYMDGRLVMEQGDIHALLDLVTWNNRWEKRSDLRNVEAKSRLPGDPFGWLRTYNQERRSKRNVAHHYDLSARLYDLFLDSDRQYSCAYFTDRDNPLEQAQLDKKAHIAAKLYLKPGMKVLDIGCGWGGMALYLHEKTGVEVLGITLSEEQLRIARERAEKADVADKVKFELIDYRKVAGKYDRIVSVGMFEHVGPAYFRTFMAKCRSLLVEDGVMLLHTIGRIGTRRATDRWTTKYIFPGGYIPTLSEISEAAESAWMCTSDVETLRLHYGYTLEHWLRRTQAHKAEIVAMYDDRFYRMWEFYLSGAMVGFFNRAMVNYQVQYIRDRNALPITRDYMAEAEARLKV